MPPLQELLKCNCKDYSKSLCIVQLMDLLTIASKELHLTNCTSTSSILIAVVSGIGVVVMGVVVVVAVYASVAGTVEM